MLSRIPPMLRLPALLIALVATHLALGEPLETLRLLGLRALLAPFSGLAALGEGPLAEVPEPVQERIAAARASMLEPFEELAAPLPVLDLDLERGWLVVGGGSEDGVRRGALALSPLGCVGVVDRVMPSLARVRILAGEGVTLPVEVSDLSRELPGELPGLVGILEGHGDEVILTGTFLPGSFRPGDRLATLESAHPVGIVADAGVRPRVRLAATPEGLPFTSVTGAHDEVSEWQLFEEVQVEVVAPRLGRAGGALLGGEGTGELLPGSAVHARGWYLGLIRRVAPGVALVTRPGDAGRPLRVHVIPRDGGDPVAAILRGLGDERIGIDRWIGPPPSPGPVLVVTSGGQELVPPGLLVAEGDWTGTNFEGRASPGWPDTVTVSVFRHRESRRQLVSGRR